METSDTSFVSVFGINAYLYENTIHNLNKL